MRRRITLLLSALPLILSLGWAAAGAALAGGGCHQPDEAVATEGASTVVKMDGCTFAPTITRVPVGAEVVFMNTTVQAHDVTGRKFAWGSDTLQSGTQFSARFVSAGVYPYSCSLHPGMAGVVIAGSPDLALASEVKPAQVETTPAEAAPTTPQAAAPSADATLPLVAAGGAGLLTGLVIGAAAVARRRHSA